MPAGAYRFAGPAGTVTLTGLFDGHRRLLVHHTVPDRSRPAAVASAEALSAALHTRDTRLVIVSHAPYTKIEQYRRHFGWDLPVYSALDTGFAADFPATRRLEGAGPGEHDDGPGLSFFRQDGRSVLHTGSIAVPYLDFLALAGVARGRGRGWRSGPDVRPEPDARRHGHPSPTVPIVADPATVTAEWLGDNGYVQYRGPPTFGPDR